MKMVVLLLRLAVGLIVAILPLRDGLAQTALCSPQTIADAAARLAIARRALLALPIREAPMTDVSSEAQNAAVAMKRRLGELIEAYMRCAPMDGAVGSIKADLARLGHARPEEEASVAHGTPPDETLRDGYYLDFAVKKCGDRPRILGISPWFQFECGSDAMLLVFVESGGGWREALRWESGPYKVVGGALGAFDYAISPQGHGRWFAVVKSVAPWCLSYWSTIRYEALRPMPETTVPKVLYRAEERMWWGDEDFGTVTAGKDGFEVRFTGSSIDSGVHHRAWIRHFTIFRDDAVTRVDPLALSPWDFADEWIVSPWDSAARWSASVALRGVHDELHRIGSLDYESARLCRTAPDRVQVALHSDETQASYFLLVAGRADYRMAAVSTKPDPACDGEDLLSAGNEPKHH